MNAQLTTPAEAHAYFARLASRGANPERLAMMEAYVVAVLRGMPPALAAALCGLALNPAPEPQAREPRVANPEILKDI